MAHKKVAVTVDELINSQNSLRTIASLKLKPKLAYTLGVLILRKQVDSNIKTFVEYRDEKVQELGLINETTKQKYIPNPPDENKPEEVKVSKEFHELMNGALQAEVTLEIPEISIDDLENSGVTISPADMMNTWYLWDGADDESAPKSTKSSKARSGK